jgi:hypothetical protein
MILLEDKKEKIMEKYFLIYKQPNKDNQQVIAKI